MNYCNMLRSKCCNYCRPLTVQLIEVCALFLTNMGRTTRGTVREKGNNSET